MHHQRMWTSSLAVIPQSLSLPPALLSGCSGNSGIERFGTGGDTHTVPLRGARVKNLNSHLKSLRNKRKEKQKEQR